MGRGGMYALTPEQRDALVAIADDEGQRAYVEEVVEPGCYADPGERQRVLVQKGEGPFGPMLIMTGDIEGAADLAKTMQDVKVYAETVVREPVVAQLADGVPAILHLDKAWNPIHSMLTGQPFDSEEDPRGFGTYPLKLAIFGGRSLHEDDSHTFNLIEAGEVADLAAALSKLDAAWCAERARTTLGGADARLQAYACAYLKRMRDWLAKVAETGRPVLFTASH